MSAELKDYTSSSLQSRTRHVTEENDTGIRLFLGTKQAVCASFPAFQSITYGTDLRVGAHRPSEVKTKKLYRG